MSPTYFILWYRLNRADGYLIWFSNDIDGVIVRKDSTVRSFDSRRALQKYAKDNHILLKPEALEQHDLDRIVDWLRSPTKDSIDCNAFLEAWNLFVDVARSSGNNFFSTGKRTDPVYEKLFWGSNLLALTPAGKRYVPDWTQGQIKTLIKVLSSGLRVFREAVGHIMES